MAQRRRLSVSVDEEIPHSAEATVHVLVSSFKLSTVTNDFVSPSRFIGRHPRMILRRAEEAR